LWHKGLAKDIEDLWEPWMREVDQLLEDAALVEEVYQAQGKRHPKSQIGRTQTPAKVALRLLILKHVRNWSYDMLEREVRANLVYRAFTRIGDEKVPDAKRDATMGRSWSHRGQHHSDGPVSGCPGIGYAFPPLAVQMRRGQESITQMRQGDVSRQIGLIKIDHFATESS
jgi:hypothetical protein